MRKLKNPFATKGKKQKCFGCSQKNPYSLNMQFFEDNNSFWSEWKPRKEFESWENIIHGGIQACLIDETAGWLVVKKLGRFTVTKELDIKFKKPLYLNKGIVKTTAIIQSVVENIANIDVEILDSEMQLCTKAIGAFYLFSEEDSKIKYDIPSADDF
ncbi:PaaI family thioesterase [Bacteroidales bacterium OttesenSCG-928-I21]|nr:PaaI family thioesterase [Bacteroidales bacterium OttesenSCG-928-I21]